MLQREKTELDTARKEKEKMQKQILQLEEQNEILSYGRADTPSSYRLRSAFSDCRTPFPLHRDTSETSDEKDLERCNRNIDLLEKERHEIIMKIEQKTAEQNDLKKCLGKQNCPDSRIARSKTCTIQ